MLVSSGGWGGRWALRAHPRIAARRGSPGPADWRAPGAASRSRPEGGAPRTRPRRAAPAPAPAPLPPDSPFLPRKRACLPTHTQPGEKCFCSLWAVVSQEFDVIISQNGTAKLRVAFFSSLYCVKKKKKKTGVRLPVREWLSNKRANKISWVEIKLYKCFPTRKTIFTGVCTVCVVWQFFVLKQ